MCVDSQEFNAECTRRGSSDNTCHLERFVIARENPACGYPFAGNVSSLGSDRHSARADIGDDAPPAAELIVTLRTECDFPSLMSSSFCAAIRWTATIVILYDTL